VSPGARVDKRKTRLVYCRYYELFRCDYPVTPSPRACFGKCVRDTQCVKFVLLHEPWAASLPDFGASGLAAHGFLCFRMPPAPFEKKSERRFCLSLYGYVERKL